MPHGDFERSLSGGILAAGGQSRREQFRRTSQVSFSTEMENQASIVRPRPRSSSERRMSSGSACCKSDSAPNTPVSLDFSGSSIALRHQLASQTSVQSTSSPLKALEGHDPCFVRVYQPVVELGALVDQVRRDPNMTLDLFTNNSENCFSETEFKENHDGTVRPVAYNKIAPAGTNFPKNCRLGHYMTHVQHNAGDLIESLAKKVGDKDRSVRALQRRVADQSGDVALWKSQVDVYKTIAQEAAQQVEREVQSVRRELAAHYDSKLELLDRHIAVLESRNREMQDAQQEHEAHCSRYSHRLEKQEHKNIQLRKLLPQIGEIGT